MDQAPCPIVQYNMVHLQISRDVIVSKELVKVGCRHHSDPDTELSPPQKHQNHSHG